MVKRRAHPFNLIISRGFQALFPSSHPPGFLYSWYIQYSPQYNEESRSWATSKPDGNVTSEFLTDVLHMKTCNGVHSLSRNYLTFSSQLSVFPLPLKRILSITGLRSNMLSFSGFLLFFSSHSILNLDSKWNKLFQVFKLVPLTSPKHPISSLSASEPYKPVSISCYHQI